MRQNATVCGHLVAKGILVLDMDMYREYLADGQRRLGNHRIPLYDSLSLKTHQGVQGV